MQVLKKAFLNIQVILSYTTLKLKTKAEAIRPETWQILKCGSMQTEMFKEINLKSKI